MGTRDGYTCGFTLYYIYIFINFRQHPGNFFWRLVLFLVDLNVLWRGTFIMFGEQRESLGFMTLRNSGCREIGAKEDSFKRAYTEIL